ncbi:MAG: hypothetical protein MJ176_02875 [Treponema sp.]|nr:hypothetical protein [Treponema sp.]
MASILIKDTTKEERERIVAEALGDEYGFGCGYEGTGIDYQLYIDGKKELRELNMEHNCGFEVGFPEDNPRSSCMSE